MNTTLFAGAAALALAAAPVWAQEATPDLWTDVIIVHGTRLHSGPDVQAINPEREPVYAADAAALATRMPGGALNNNGAISGQVQYRGLYGPRIRTTINGQKFGSGGPNLMDPPLHYAPLPLLDRLEFSRGIAPVSKGEGLGGAVNAVLKRGQFTETDRLTPQLDVMSSYNSANASTASGGLAALGSQHVFIEALAAHEQGGNTRFPGGRIAASRHQRDTYGGGFGLRGKPGNEFVLECRHQDTRRTGNPPFPMDIRFFKTDLVQASGKAGFGSLTARLHAGYAFVDHAMNNFGLRQPPASPAKYREALASALTWAWGGTVSAPLAGGTLEAGVDGANERHKARITNPNNARFIVQNFNDVRQNRLGGYVQWSADPLPGWMLQAGLRTDRIGSNTGPARASLVFPPPVQMLAARFNARDRHRVDHNADAVLQTSYALSDAVTVRLGLARKQRTPSYLERYGWLPTTASAGLADGNVYIGDPGLKPETARVIDAGVDIRTRRAYLRPALYYRRISNYIQGVPFDATPGVIDSPEEMVARANGDATPLRFANVKAELYGLDADFGFAIAGPWRLDGIVSAVRGKRRDVRDNLYRISPPRLDTALRYERPDWSAAVHLVAVAHQHKVSQTNSEQPSPGYVLVNLQAQWQIDDHVSLSGGVHNVFDRLYRQHLAGYNRVAGSDVALGARLPGAGRGLYLRLGVKL